MLDTRQKILTPEQALESLKGCRVFVAYFDVLSAPLVRRLSEIGQPVVVVVLDPPDPLLPARTRAELAAALKTSKAVVPLAGPPDEFLERLQPADIIHWEGEDAQRLSGLIEHVQSLQIN
jgi:hypothetical protein